MQSRNSCDRDYYRILEVDIDAGEEEIKKAYRRMALQWHPDRNPGNPAATERFKDISEAYAVLIDPAKRRQYDLSRQPGGAGHFEYRRDDLFRDMFSNPSAFAVFEEMAKEFERMGLHVDRHYFERTLFGGRTVVTGGVFIISPLTPFLALFRLARAALAQPRPPGSVESAASPVSGVLSGLGRLARRMLGSPASAVSVPEDREDVSLVMELDPDEAERGGRKKILIDTGGTPRQLVVNIPRAVRDKSRLRLRGQGRTAPDGSRGDLLLIVEVRKSGASG